jgi:uncharacterized delta-60 repeat protein
MKKIYTTIALLFGIIMFAQDGTLDTTFGTGGKVTTFIGGSNCRSNAMALQSDRKILLTGRANASAYGGFVTLRYNASGTIDNTFGTGGKVVTIIGDLFDVAISVKIQNDGKILVAGTAIGLNSSVFAIVRYNTNGTLDSSFGTGGIVTTSIGFEEDGISALAIQTDGKIVASGYTKNSGSNNFDIVIARYNTNGSLDSNFGSSGITVLTLSSSRDFASSTAIQPDGRILVGGYYKAINDYDFVLLRYNSNGSLDNSFGVNGIVKTDIGLNNDEANALILQPDLKITLAGKTYNGTNWDFAMVRYNNNGSLDSSFGTAGIVIKPIGSADDIANSLLLQTDNKIVVGGSSNNGNDNDFAVLRYNNNGTLDSSFGTSGQVITTFISGMDELKSLALQSDGKILASGFGGIGSGGVPVFAIARYNNPSLGIQTIENLKFSISPNPTNSILNIKTQETLKSINIIDLLGRKTNITKFENNAIDLSNLQNGVYFLEITTENGLQTQKFIKN